MKLHSLPLLALSVVWLAIGLVEGLERGETNAIFLLAVSVGVVSFLPRTRAVGFVHGTIVGLLCLTTYSVAADASWALPAIAGKQIVLAPAPLLLAFAAVTTAIRGRDRTERAFRSSPVAITVGLGVVLLAAAAALSTIFLAEYSVPLARTVHDATRTTVELVLLLVVAGSASS